MAMVVEVLRLSKLMNDERRVYEGLDDYDLCLTLIQRRLNCVMLAFHSRARAKHLERLLENGAY